MRKVAATIEEGAPPPLAEPEARLLQRYVDRFNARDFDAVRAMLSDDVRLDLVEREKRRGALRVAHYFHNYDAKRDWQLSVGVADGRPAILVADRAGPARVDYIMLVTWKDGAVAAIRDYRYARHVMAEVAVAA